MMQTYLQENMQRVITVLQQTWHNIMFKRGKFQTKFNIIYPSFLAKYTCTLGNNLIARKPQMLFLFLSKSGAFPIALWDTASSYSFVI